MSTISFSVEDDVRKDIASWAKIAKKSKSDLFRDMVTMYSFNQRLDLFANKSDEVLNLLGISTEDELYEYLENNEIYQDRLRQ